MPLYSENARLARAEGVVILNAVIRKEGHVEVINVVRSVGYGLDEIAIRTVRDEWIFKPALLNDSSIDYPVEIDMEFKIY